MTYARACEWSAAVVVSIFTAIVRARCSFSIQLNYLRHFINANMVWCHLFRHHSANVSGLGPERAGTRIWRTQDSVHILSQFDANWHSSQLAKRWVSLNGATTSFIEWKRAVWLWQLYNDIGIGRKAESNCCRDDDVRASAPGIGTC